MKKRKYKIATLSARSIASYCVQSEDGVLHHYLSLADFDKCRLESSTGEQDDTPLFYQLMCIQQKGKPTFPAGNLVPDLREVIFYVDFSGIFDRSENSPKVRALQEKARAMFSPEGIHVVSGDGTYTYLAFERSGSMSRESRMAFIRADYYEEARRRIQMDLHIGECQLSKLYAYNGLMLSGGTRVDDIEIDRPHRVVVIDNPEITVPSQVITVEPENNANPRKYRRVEKQNDVKVTCFDGVGLVSTRYAAVINRKLDGQAHTSFQIRMPFIKGMVHAVDFHSYLKKVGVRQITDLWGIVHPLNEVDMILTKSQFKGYGWLTADGKVWADYWDAFRRYHHALYITQVSKLKPENQTELNYQFLNTLSITEEEFRPADLPLGWEHSPEEDSRSWLTKATETAYYQLRRDQDYRLACFTEKGTSGFFRKKDNAYWQAEILRRNPLFLREYFFLRALDDRAESLLRHYTAAQFLIEGDNRYLCGDLLELLNSLCPLESRPVNGMKNYGSPCFYAPGAAYSRQEFYTLLRNPHIARNEEVQLKAYPGDKLRNQYLGHLTDVVMVPAEILAAERLGGADYDGDMVKTIADPILNRCVSRNYADGTSLPLLKIPSETPAIRDAEDWEARYETVKNTFSSRVGQICNAALDRSVIAYDENSKAEERTVYRQETELLAILTGLEIDSAKSGIKPDLTRYLRKDRAKRSSYLKYKGLVEKSSQPRRWYEKTSGELQTEFLESRDWSKETSNLEKLPWLGQQLKENTLTPKEKPAKDEELFRFAQNADRKEQLDPEILETIRALVKDYDTCRGRLKNETAPPAKPDRKSDVERILFSKGLQGIVSADELYTLLNWSTTEQLRDTLAAMQEENWAFMPEEQREGFLRQQLPGISQQIYLDLLTDFRCGGHRLLGDILLGLLKSREKEETRRSYKEGDSPALREMLESCQLKLYSTINRENIQAVFLRQLRAILPYQETVRYLVALDKCSLAIELLPEETAKQMRKENRHAE